jgi:DNA modification methylase
MSESNFPWKLLYMRKAGKTYNLHSYWTKQSVDVIDKFIDYFTKEGDTVLDCFCGSGSVGISAKKQNRIAYLYDISPICCEISKGYTTKIDNLHNLYTELQIFKKEMERELEPILNIKEGEIKSRIKYALYSKDYMCPKCSNRFDTFEKDVGELRNGIKENEYSCPKCGFSDYKSFEPLELKLTATSSGKKIFIKGIKNYLKAINSISDIESPDVAFFGKEPKRNYKLGIKSVYQLYSKPNRIVLNRIKRYINKIDDPKVKQVFSFTFSSILFNCSLLSAYTKYENTTYRTGTYYIPKIIKDNNPLDAFYSKFELISKTLSKLYPYDSPVFIFNKSATNMEELNDKSIDYIFIDPPYSDNISYSELNIVWEAWLNLKGNYKEEAIITKVDKKDDAFYKKLMTIIFGELNRVLKDKGNLTLIFHNNKPLHWALIQEAVNNNRFVLQNKLPIRIRSKSRTYSQINTNKLVQGFLAFNFIKIKDETRLIYLEDVEYSNLIKQLKEEAMQKGFKSLSDIYDYIITMLFPKYVIRDFEI